MRVAVIGAGGIGGPLGASLAAAGHDVTFVARGAHLAAIRANGLRIEGDRGLTHITPAQATDDPASIGKVDLILFAVRLWDVEAAGAQCRPLIGPETAIIPLQNGIDASERLLPILGADHVLGATGLVTGTITAPGIVRQSGTHHRITFGELDRRHTPRLEMIHAACRAAGIDAILSDDIQRTRWEKFIMLVPTSGVCAVTRSALGPLRADPDCMALFEAAMQEVYAVGRAAGIALDPAILDTTRAFFAGVPDAWTPSMAVALMNGQRLELPWLAGRVAELGRSLGVPTPVNTTLYAALKPFMNGAAQ